MNTNDMIAEIRDANLGYLMLAQQMIRADKATAIFRLGISSDVYRWNGDGWSLATDHSTMTGGPIESTDVMPHVH